MKKDIHPAYMPCKVTCACGNNFVTRSTRPSVHVDICNTCHPYFTGKQKFVDNAGRIERFQRKFKGEYFGGKPGEKGADKAAPAETPAAVPAAS